MKGLVSIVAAAMIAAVFVLGVSSVNAQQCNVPQQQAVSSASILQQQAALSQLLQQQAAANQRTATAVATAQPAFAPIAVLPPGRSAVATATSSSPPVVSIPALAPPSPVATASASSGGSVSARAGGRHGFHPLQRLRPNTSVARSVVRTRG